jgi:hypothetical protein
MKPEERRNLGAHYTSEANILKLIKPLFLDALYQEFESVRDNKNKLIDFHKKLRMLKFLDPACGCGNFLVITYRELRLLELEILRVLYPSGQRVIDVKEIIRLDVDQFYGIEYEEFPARIAETAMWLIDHQMNMLISNELGQYFVRLPLQKAAQIYHGDALEIDWQTIVPKDQLSYIIGNPPFIGAKLMKQAQRDQIVKLFEGVEGSGVLDYVTGWYIKAAQYMQETAIKAAFVSTNSIVQGEQVSVLWGKMLGKYNIKIHFAHRTFKWSNEAKGNAAVYCVVIGFAPYDCPDKKIFEYEDIKGPAHEIKVKNINPYLVDAKDILIGKRSRPICNVPEMSFGNMPLDGGFLLFSEAEKEDFLKQEPKAEPYVLPFISAHEFLNGKKRWCLWLVDVEPNELKKMPKVMARIEAVKKFRLESKAPSTQKFAATPTLFRDRNRPESFIVVPRVSSENREYIPMVFFDKNSIVGDTCMAVPSGGMYHFGVLSSKMHMVWVKYVCGRLKSDYRYSKDIVYNNFPWPQSPAEKQTRAIEAAAQKVLEARLQFPNSSLADLYDPLTMPPVLAKAHKELDKAVDLAYRPQAFSTEAGRMEFLLGLYEKYTANLFTPEKPKRARRK